MDAAVGDFIRTHRTRLGEEKARTGLEWNSRRRAYGDERHGPRQEELSRGSFGKENRTPSDYVRDIRHRLSEDRDEELRQYRGGRQDNAREMRHDHPSDSYYQHREPRHHNERKRGTWAEDERELDSWMRQQGKYHGSVRQQSASYRAGRDLEDNNSSRSISAPVFGLPGFGQQRDDPNYRRKKQMQYAAELKEQIREKKEAKRRERDEIDRPSRYQDIKRRGREPDELRHRHHQRNDHDDYPDDRDMHGYRQPPPDRYRRQHPPPERDYYPPPHGYDPPHYYPPPHHYPSYPHYPPPPHHHKYYDPYHYSGNPYLSSRRPEWSRDVERSPSPPRSHRPRREVRIADRHEDSDDRNHKQSSYFGPPATSKSDKASYQQELHRQIVEKKEREERDRREKDRYFSKLEEDAKNYNPWGKPGAGAPLRDEKGNIVAGRGLRKSIDGTSPRYAQLTEDELKKITQEKHAQDLTQQIKEREQQRELERMKKQIADLRDNERIEREEKELQMQYKKELSEEQMKLEKANAEKALKKQLQSEGPTKEELARMKLEEELAKKAKKQQEQQEKLDKLYQKMSEGPCTDQRAVSPPIPALRNKPGPPRSPPIPTLRQKQTTESLSGPQATVVPHQLESQNTVLPPHHQPKPQDTVPSPQSQDTAVVPRPQPVEEQSPVVRVPVQPSVEYQRSSSPVQILPVTTNPVRSNESAKLLKGLSSLKNHIKQRTTLLTDTNPATHTEHTTSDLPKHPRMPQQWRDSETQAGHGPTSTAMEEFTRLKYKQPTESRMGLWQQYPEPPRTNTALEMQQDAMLKYQQQQLDRAREQNSKTYASNSRHRRWEPTAHPTIADTRSASPGGHSQLSITTLDIDRLAAANREREQRLESILNARPSVNADDRKVLQTFLDKSNSNQPTRSNRSASHHLVSRLSERSLDAESAFKPLATQNDD